MTAMALVVVVVVAVETLPFHSGMVNVVVQLVADLMVVIATFRASTFLC